MSSKRPQSDLVGSAGLISPFLSCFEDPQNASSLSSRQCVAVLVTTGDTDDLDMSAEDFMDVFSNMMAEMLGGMSIKAPFPNAPAPAHA